MHLSNTCIAPPTSYRSARFEQPIPEIDANSDYHDYINRKSNHVTQDVNYASLINGQCSSTLSHIDPSESHQLPPVYSSLNALVHSSIASTSALFTGASANENAAGGLEGEVVRLKSENSVLTQVIAGLTEQIQLLGSQLRQLELLFNSEGHSTPWSTPRLTADASTQCSFVPDLCHDPEGIDLMLEDVDEDSDLVDFTGVTIRKPSHPNGQGNFGFNSNGSLNGSFRKNRSFSVRSSHPSIQLIPELDNYSCHTNPEEDPFDKPSPLRRLRSFTSLNGSANMLNPFSRSFLLRKSRSRTSLTKLPKPSLAPYSEIEEHILRNKNESTV